ncbi:hypothetical protein KKE92_04650 [Candidatus Micrarchaeota archaeon]|nr:hypothetical protein [Candidatus Micrarchaeota archaeon]MBU1681742.1 hypothetical protein [Candidatus Micrarchaeota archaeon]
MKGQYFSFDAIIASVIFVLALVALLSYWHSVRSFLDFQNDALSKDVVRVSNLVFTPPSPSSDCGTLDRLGFANDWNDRRINESLIYCAQGKTQAQLRDLLGSSNNLSLRFENLANGTVTVVGGDIPVETTDVIRVRRLATVVNSTGGTYLAALDMSLYK